MGYLIRKKLKSLVDPTQLARFPFKTPLFEYPTTYLAKKHRGLVVARRMLKRRAATAPAVASRRPKASVTARLFIMFWMFLIVLSPDLQEMVIMDTLGFITVGALIVINALQHMELWQQIGLGFVCAFVLVFMVQMCRHHRGKPKEIDPDSDDEDDEAETKTDTTQKQPEEEVETSELAADVPMQQVVLF